MSVEVIEIAPPAVATDLMPRSRSNPMAQQLDDYIAEVMDLLAKGGREVQVERVKLLRQAESSGGYEGVFYGTHPAG